MSPATAGGRQHRWPHCRVLAGAALGKPRRTREARWPCCHAPPRASGGPLGKPRRSRLWEPPLATEDGAGGLLATLPCGHAGTQPSSLENRGASSPILLLQMELRRCRFDVRRSQIKKLLLPTEVRREADHGLGGRVNDLVQRLACLLPAEVQREAEHGRGPARGESGGLPCF